MHLNGGIPKEEICKSYHNSPPHQVIGLQLIHSFIRLRPSAWLDGFIPPPPSIGRGLFTYTSHEFNYFKRLNFQLLLPRIIILFGPRAAAGAAATAPLVLGNGAFIIVVLYSNTAVELFRGSSSFTACG